MIIVDCQDGVTIAGQLILNRDCLYEGSSSLLPPEHGLAETNAEGEGKRGNHVSKVKLKQRKKYEESER